MLPQITSPLTWRLGPKRLARLLTATLCLALLATSGSLLVTNSHVIENTRGVVRPWAYTGPVSLIEQRFRADHDNLRRIDVWAEIDGGASAEIFARLTPEGSDRPVRESRAEVRGARFSNATTAFHFAPIPDSGGATYTLAVGVLSGPLPYVFLGLTSGDVFPQGAAVVSGTPTRNADDLAMRTFWRGRFVEVLRMQGPKHLALAGQATLLIFLVVFPIVATWRGLSGPKPRFWRRFVWPTVRTSALITVVILFIALAATAGLSTTQLA